MTAGRLLDLLRANGLTAATAESLTGGLVAAAITDVPGASRCFRGGIVAYATQVKQTVLGVPDEVLRRHGPVAAATAAAMAEGARQRMGADIGLATTGVAGPDPQDGVAVGVVFVAVAGVGPEPVVRRLALSGGRGSIRSASVDAVLELGVEVLGNATGARGVSPHRERTADG